jgi:ACT domain-containing protein
MKELIVLGVYVKERSKNALNVQDILTRYGCSIKTRLGLHEVSGDFCSNSGLILLELTGDRKEIDNLINELKSLDDIEIQTMVFHV